MFYVRILFWLIFNLLSTENLAILNESFTKATRLTVSIYTYKWLTSPIASLKANRTHDNNINGTFIEGLDMVRYFGTANESKHIDMYLFQLLNVTKKYNQ